MSEWYERAYPGGKMVACKGFPRPLYPPDAAPGHDPSPDAEDCEAYKRVVSRAGRWPWGKFDRAYSNAFAHGKPGGAVKDSGVAGVQRQQNIQPTGFIGQDTFNLLRSIKIPEGLPNAGQMAMDATAVKLIDAAFDRFKAKPPADEEALRDRIVEFCETAIKNASAWDYRQYRPVPLNVNPASPPDGDCSSSVLWAYDFARRKCNAVDEVPDPAMQSWSGYGNTDLYEDEHPQVSGSYKVGDLGHYQGHVTLCIAAGSWESSDWFSFGSEPPSRRKLNYRSDFRFVCRPPLC